MSTPRNQRTFQGMIDQIKRLGPYSNDPLTVITWSGQVDSSNTDGFAGMDAAVLDFGSGKKVIVIAEPAGAQFNAAFKTQSHAAGHFIDGSSRFHAFMETPANWTGANARFKEVVQHHILGQLAAPLKFWLSANGDGIAVKGVAGAGATTASAVGAEWLIPYGQVYAGGV
jgi:hypothetical protein